MSFDLVTIKRLESLREQLRLIRIQYPQSSDIYNEVSNVENKIIEMTASNKRMPMNPEREREKILRYFRTHPHMPIAPVAQYAGCFPSVLRDAVRGKVNNGSVVKLPLKYVNKIIEVLVDYGY